LADDEALGLLAVPIERKRDEREDPAAEDESALSLQAGFAQQVLECAIRHGGIALNWA
jgi:hypothetical protein